MLLLLLTCLDQQMFLSQQIYCKIIFLSYRNNGNYGYVTSRILSFFNFYLHVVPSSLDVPLGCDANIPRVAQELIKKMIHQFAMEYASKCLLHTSKNGVTTRTSSPLSETSDAPLDLTVNRTQEEKESEHEPGKESIKHTVN